MKDKTWGGYYKSSLWHKLIWLAILQGNSGGEQWSTVTDSIASFTTLRSAPLKSLVCHINPVQDLHGYDSPWPAGGGKNKLSLASVSLGGTDNRTKRIEIDAIPAGTYVFTATNTGTETSTGNYGLQFFDAVAGGSNVGQAVNGSTFTLTGEAISIYFYMNSDPYSDGKTVILSDMMIRPASVTDATFAPYSNICPISGWTGCEVTRTGKNLLNLVKNEMVSTGWNRRFPISLKAGTYIISCQNQFGASAKGASVNLTDENDATIIKALTSGYTFGDTTFVGTAATITEEEAKKIKNIRFALRAGGTTYNDIAQGDIQLELGSTASPYEPYNGNSYSVTWQDEAGTVYGGTDEVIGGNGTSTHELYNFRTYSASRIFAYDYNGKHGVYFQYGYSITADRDSGLCNVTVVSTTADNPASHYMWFGVNSAHVFWIGILDALGMTLEQFKTWLTQNDVIITRRLATPQTYQLTPQEVDTLVGQNNIWHDANGDTTVEYRSN